MRRQADDNKTPDDDEQQPFIFVQLILFDFMVDLMTAAVVAIAAVVAVIILVFNGLIAKRNRVKDAWAQITVQLKRRYDLIPNLIETVKGYMKYEKEVLTKVTALRSSILSGSVKEKADANNKLTQTLKSLFAVAENYPALKASETYQNLQEELANTENKISFVRTSYNDYVLDYNTAIEQFPGVAFAGLFGFKEEEFFGAPEQEKKSVKVDLTSESGTDSESQQKKGSRSKRK